jgi:hypothetical protein
LFGMIDERAGVLPYDCTNVSNLRYTIQSIS